jgi:hypothetical protein
LQFTPATTTAAIWHLWTCITHAELKQAVTKLASARTKVQLVKVTARQLRSVQRQPERVKKYFEHGPVRYAV